MDKGRSVVEVNWTKTDELTEYTSYHDILELLCTDGSVKSPVHYDHLPALGKGIKILILMKHQYV